MNGIVQKKFLGVIPARAGSRRLPGKNLRVLGGKPLVQWTIEAALRAGHLDEVVVSTDSQEIADISRRSGARVPFLRPVELSGDLAASADVMKHALEYYAEVEKKCFEYIVMLQPTSPLRDAHDIDQAIGLLSSRNADAVISVCETEHSPLWSSILPEDCSMDGFLRQDVKSKRSQDLPRYYRLNGAIYVCRVKNFLKEGTFFLEKNSFAFVMPRERSVDIDSLLDFKSAEILMAMRGEEGGV